MLSLLVVMILYTMVESTMGRHGTVEFARMRPWHCGPWRLSPAWLERTVSSCAASCLDRFSNCYGFMYNTATRMCTPSSGLSAEQPLPSLEEGDFYFTDSCLSYPDFSIKSNGSTQANVALYYTPKLNYINAWAACECMNSHLYVANSLEKFWLINAIKDSIHFIFMGLDDIATEGKFVWADSGQEIDSKLKRAIFTPGAPDNRNNEDCTVIHPMLQTVNDGRCTSALAYICEKPHCLNFNEF